MNKRCFVISPIGAEGSPVREHADDVFDYIIRPAMEQCGIEAVRSDRMLEHGKITDQMFGAILNYDLCAAVLTGHNPNVFYEMAIAQSAARPVIMLIEKGEPLPFDIRDQRCVQYTLKPRPLFERAYVKEIVGHVQSLERAGWKVDVPFGVAIPLGGGADAGRHHRFWERAMDYGRTDDRLRLLLETEQVFDLMGMNQDGWLRIKGFGEAVARKAAAGCKARILIMHPDNPALPQLINEALPELTPERTIFEIRYASQSFQRLAEANPNIELRQLRRGCLHAQLTRTDNHAFVTQYLYSRRPGWSPLWQCGRGSPLYQLVQEEFESLWNVNPPEPAWVPIATGEGPPPPPSRKSAARPRRRPNGRA
jgi:hypothetical protein